MRRDALEMQKRKLERYAAEKGLPITGYYEDDGFPGQDLNRPGLTRLRMIIMPVYLSKSW